MTSLEVLPASHTMLTNGQRHTQAALIVPIVKGFRPTSVFLLFDPLPILS